MQIISYQNISARSAHSATENRVRAVEATGTAGRRALVPTAGGGAAASASTVANSVGVCGEWRVPAHVNFAA